MSFQGQYGFPCVTDPNDFSPDYESCSPEEIAAHKLACQTFGTPEYVPNRGCTTEHDESGNLVRHVLRTSWGIGVNNIRMCDGECKEPIWDSFVTCHECGGYLDFCPECWATHERTEHAE